MSLTKVVLTGTVDTIKQGWTKFNDLIDDLLSTTNGLGASTIGIEDSAGNLSAANVEAALAEIYTDTSSSRTMAEVFNEDPDTTTALTWGYQGGILRNDNVLTTVADGTLALADDSTNYVEIDSAGTVSRNTTSFTAGKIPIREVTTVSGAQTVSTDKRAWFDIKGWLPVTDVTHDLGSSSLRFLKAYVQTSYIENFFNTPGLYKRPKFSWKDADEIYLGGGAYYQVKDKIAYWTAQLTMQLTTAAGANEWHFLFIDYSDIPALGNIDAGDLNWSTTAPTWNATYGAWMTGDDRCIFMVRTPVNNETQPFYHNGGRLVIDGNPLEALSTTADNIASWTDLSLAVGTPDIVTQALIIIEALVPGGNVADYIVEIRPNGDTTMKHVVISCVDDTGQAAEVIANTDSSQVIEIQAVVNDADLDITVDYKGWYLPEGM